MYKPTSVIIFALIASINGYETVPQPYYYNIDFYPDMPVDHFSYTINKTFKMRFLYNDTWYKDDGPIFFYTGNEGDITSFGDNTVNLLHEIFFWSHKFYK